PEHREEAAAARRPATDAVLARGLRAARRTRAAGRGGGARQRAGARRRTPAGRALRQRTAAAAERAQRSRAGPVRPVRAPARRAAVAPGLDALAFLGPARGTVEGSPARSGLTGRRQRVFGGETEVAQRSAIERGSRQRLDRTPEARRTHEAAAGAQLVQQGADGGGIATGLRLPQLLALRGQLLQEQGAQLR